MIHQFAWHIHHEGFDLHDGRRTPLERLTEPIENRVSYIEINKPKRHHALRKRLLKPVKGKLPTAVTKAAGRYLIDGDALDHANAIWCRDIITDHDYGKSRNAFLKAKDKYHKAITKHFDKIEALHAKECPNCPWDGRTIFPRKRKK